LPITLTAFTDSYKKLPPTTELVFYYAPSTKSYEASTILASSDLRHRWKSVPMPAGTDLGGSNLSYILFCALNMFRGYDE